MVVGRSNSELLVQVKNLIDRAELTQATKLLEIIKNSKSLEQQLWAQYYIATIHYHKNNFSLALNILEDIINNNESTQESVFLYSWSELLKIRIFIDLEEITDAESSLSKLRRNVLNSSDLPEDEKKLLLTLILLEHGRIWLKKANFHKSREFFRTCKEYFCEKNDEAMVGRTLYFLGILELIEGNLDQSEKFLEKGYYLYKQSGKKVQLPSMAYNYGIILLKQGKLVKASRLLRESLKTARKIEDRINIAFATNSLGSVAFIQGKMSEALEKYYKAVCEIEQSEKSFLKYHFYYNIGLIYKEKLAFDEAFAWFSQTLKLVAKNSDPIDYRTISLILYSMTILFIETGNYQKAREKINKMKMLEEKTDEPIVQARRRLVEAILLKNSYNLRDQARAYAVLENIISSSSVDYALKEEAILQMCDLLLLEAISLQNNESVKKLEFWIKTLRRAGQKQKNAWAFLASLRLQAQIDFFNGYYEEAFQNLSSAIRFADEEGMLHWATIISNDQDNLMLTRPPNESTLPLANSLTQRKWALLTTASQALIRTPRRELLRSEKPLYFVIVMHYQESMAAVVISPIDSNCSEEFVSELIRIITQQIWYKTFQGFYSSVIDDQILLIKKKNEFYYAYVYDGNSYIASQKVDFLIDIFHKEYSTLLTQLIHDTTRIQHLKNKAKIVFELFMPFEPRNDKRKNEPQINVQIFLNPYDLSTVEEGSIKKIPTNNPSKQEIIDLEIAELVKKKQLFHPIKLAILRFLYKNIRLTASDLRSLLGLPWGNFVTHYTFLANNGFIEVKTEFSQTYPRTTFYITDKGIQEYERLIKTLKKVIS